jgi:AbrB family looped-hinge helix DNA binding protein
VLIEIGNRSTANQRSNDQYRTIVLGGLTDAYELDDSSKSQPLTRACHRPKAKVLRGVLPDMSKSTRVTEKGQTTIPKDLREKYDLEPGDEVVWVDTDEGIVVKKRTRAGGRGMLVPEDTSEKKREEIAEELEQRVRDRRDRNYEEA